MKLQFFEHNFQFGGFPGMGLPQFMDGLFHGKSQTKMDDN